MFHRCFLFQGRIYGYKQLLYFDKISNQKEILVYQKELSYKEFYAMNSFPKLFDLQLKFEFEKLKLKTQNKTATSKIKYSGISANCP